MKGGGPGGLCPGASLDTESGARYNLAKVVTYFFCVVNEQFHSSRLLSELAATYLIILVDLLGLLCLECRLLPIMLRKLPIILFPYSHKSYLLFHTDVPIYHLPIIPL